MAALFFAGVAWAFPNRRIVSFMIRFDLRDDHTGDP